MIHQLNRGGGWHLIAVLALAVLAPGWTRAAEPAILTPRPGPEPRINGAKVFGVRPGSPFLFTIPATGERPLRYAARGLPEGLRLDPATGQISGRLDRAGNSRRRLRGLQRATARPAARSGSSAATRSP